MAYMIVFLCCLFFILGAGLLAGWSDLRGMTIPNSLPMVVSVAFLPAYVAVYLSGAEIFSTIQSHLLATAILFVVSFFMFSIKMIGGGDSKLLSAYALWMGVKGLPVYLLYMALFGGVLGVCAIVLKKWKPFKNPPEKSWIACIQAGENKVPYGIPIVAGALMAFFALGYMRPENLFLFLERASL